MGALDKKVYEDDVQRKSLGHMLETLDQIRPIYISREEYDTIGGEILKKIGNDGLRDSYELYLPIDMKAGEQIYIVNLLINRFKLNNQGLDELVVYLKIVVGIILRIDMCGKSELDSLARKFNLPEEFISKVKEHRITPNRISRDFVKAIKVGRGKDKEGKINTMRLGEQDKENSTLVYSHLLHQEFNLTFFRKAINDIRHGLKIVTKSEQDAVISNYENPLDKFTKSTDLDGTIVYSKGDDDIIIHNINPPEISQRIREKIGMDRLKQELQLIRKSGNKKEITQKEWEVANQVAREIHNGFIYYSDKNNYGYQIQKILQTKQVHCIGFSIIGHAFFSELGIVHYGGDMVDHSSLKIHIGGKEYIFDATRFDSLVEIIKSIPNSSAYQETYVKHDWYDDIQEGNAEKILLSQILGSKGLDLYILGYYEEALSLYDKVLELHPSDGAVYYNKGNALEALRNKKLGRLYRLTSDILIGNSSSYTIWYRKERGIIKSFINQKDFSGLRDYLSGLEKKKYI